MYALSWKLLIKGLILEYFATLLKRLHLKKIASKMFHISSPSVLVLMGRSRMFFLEIRIKFHLGRAQGRSKRGYRGEKPKMKVVFLQNSHY